MRCLLGLRHREIILKHVPPGGRLLEWGCGGSTLWFADHLPQGATLTTVEHDEAWFARVSEACGARDNVSLILRPPTGPLGRNATIEEEDPRPLFEYVHAVDGERFDVILVDGYARGACLEQARSLLAPGGVVFLHDAQRPWYDQSKPLFREHGTVGSCPDYPIPLLWFGGRDLPLDEAVGLGPTVVSYYTTGTPYAALAERLRHSCDALGVPHHIVAREARGSWEANCATKADVCGEASAVLDTPILWVDADAVVHRPPTRLFGVDADFAVHKWDGWQFASGTIYFGRSPLARTLLERWLDRCRQEPRTWDQVHLDLAWEEVAASSPLHTMWLPRSYCQIFDAPTLGEPPVIEHFQASRELKRVTTPGAPVPTPRPTRALFEARLASRPLRRALQGADSQDFEEELAVERLLLEQNVSKAA